MAIIDHAISKISTLLGISTTTASSTLEAILDSREQERIAQVRRYWHLYNGRHYDYEREDGEMPYVNMCYAMVEKIGSWMFGKKPILRGRDEIQGLIDELTDEIYENSGGQRLYTDLHQQGGVSGDAILQVGYDPEVNYGVGGVVMRVLDSERTFWEYRNVGQRRKLHRVMMIWDELDENGEIRTFSEVWSDTEVKVYPPGRVLSVRDVAAFDMPAEPPILTDGDGTEFAVFPNPYGELPFVHIPNLMISQNVHGRSDLHDLWVLNKEMDESLMAYKDNVNYHSNPITLLFGISAKEVEKGANKVWGNLPKDGRVENLEVTQTYEQIKSYMALLEKYTGLVGIPYNLLALDERIMQGETSAAALKLMFLPLLELVERKKVTYGWGLKQAYEMALRFQDRIFGLNLSVLDGPDEKVQRILSEINGLGEGEDEGDEKAPRRRKKRKSSPVIPEDTQARLLALRAKPYYNITVEFQEHLPKDRASELANIEMELRNKLESIRGALQRLGVSDVEEKMSEIGEDQIMLGIMQRSYDETAGLTESPMGPEGPNPDYPPEGPGGNQGGDGFVDDNRGGRGRKQRPSNVNQVEDQTGQSSDRTARQRATRGKGGV